MDSTGLFDAWRLTNSPRQHWGLAWFLAFQFCKRFYASHGIVPYALLWQDSYYGMGLHRVICPINGKDKESLGRLTAGGDVENWHIAPDDQRLYLTTLCDQGVPTDQLVRKAIEHIRLPPLPEKSHLTCRHKRWGDSYVLVFEIATILALRKRDDLAIWNGHSDENIRRFDPKADMTEHPGVFSFEYNNKEVAVSGDGRLLDDSGRNLWHEYMAGAAPMSLATSIEKMLYSEDKA